MRRKTALITIVVFLLAPSFCFGAERFLLESELRSNYGATGTTVFLTGYTYDANGNRVLARVWSGSDSMTAPMSSVTFTYDISGNCTEELLLAGTDTLTIVRYVYGNGKLLAVRMLKKDGTLRFTDSLLYDGQDRKIEEQRLSPAGVKTFYHRYTLNTQGKTIADSLYELIASSYDATQAVIFTYNPESTVATEKQWRLSGGSWYCISTTFMRYTAGSLYSVVMYERDGVGTGMTDSLAYAYDGFGNRTSEEAYDGNRTLMHSIVYTWRDTQTSVTLISGKTRNAQRFILSNKQGRLTVDLMPKERGEIILYTIAGKLICRTAVNHSCIVPLQGVVGKGSYIAIFTSGTNRQVINFSNYN